MPEFTAALPALLLFAWLFGLRHGLDADHLAAIDGLARAQTSAGRVRMARRSGLLFSAGHGLVLMLAALLCHFFGAPPLPAWLEALGAWISLVFLLAVATLNLNAAVRPTAASAAPARLAGLLRRLVPLGAPGALVTGALFALSFDALSLAIWFFLAGTAKGGPAYTLLLVGGFVAGMVMTDAANGWFVARLIGRSEGFVDQARRLFALMLALLGFAIAGLGMLRLGLLSFDEWADEHSLWIGFAVVATSVIAFAIAAARSSRTGAGAAA